jgi:hypothetical protein
VEQEFKVRRVYQGLLEEQELKAKQVFKDLQEL